MFHTRQTRIGRIRRSLTRALVLGSTVLFCLPPVGWANGTGGEVTAGSASFHI